MSNVITEKEILELKEKVLQARDVKIKAEATLVEVLRNIEKYTEKIKELGGTDNPQTNDNIYQNMMDEIKSLNDEVKLEIEKWNL